MEIIIPESPNWVIPTAGAGSLRTAGSSPNGTDECECFSEGLCGIATTVTTKVQLADVTEVAEDLDNFLLGMTTRERSGCRSVVENRSMVRTSPAAPAQ